MKCMKKIDTVVMGRTTYDQVTQELSPDVYFFMKTSILISLPLIQNHQLLQELFTKEDPVTLIRRLKEEDGAGI